MFESDEELERLKREIKKDPSDDSLKIKVFKLMQRKGLTIPRVRDVNHLEKPNIPQANWGRSDKLANATTHDNKIKDHIRKTLRARLWNHHTNNRFNRSYAANTGLTPTEKDSAVKNYQMFLKFIEDNRKRLKELKTLKRLGFKDIPPELKESDEESRKLAREYEKTKDISHLNKLYNKLKREGKLEVRPMKKWPVTKRTPRIYGFHDNFKEHKSDRLWNKLLEKIKGPIDQERLDLLHRRHLWRHAELDDRDDIRNLEPSDEERKYTIRHREGLLKDINKLRQKLKVLKQYKKLGITKLPWVGNTIFDMPGEKVQESDESIRKTQRDSDKGKLSNTDKIKLLYDLKRRGLLEPRKQTVYPLNKAGPDTYNKAMIKLNNLRHKLSGEYINTILGNLENRAINYDTIKTLRRIGQDAQTPYKTYGKDYTDTLGRREKYRSRLRILNRARKLGIEDLSHKDLENLGY